MTGMQGFALGFATAIACVLIALLLHVDTFRGIATGYRRWRRRWLAYWDMKAAETNLRNIMFRESNGETCPQREHDEAQSWLSEASIEYARARSPQND